MSTQDVRVDVFRERIFPVLFMFVITAVFIAMVSGVYLSTREIVVRNAQLYLRRAVLFAAGLAIPDDPVELTEFYEERIEEVRTAEDGIRFYRVLDPDGSPDGYVVPEAGAGLWGEISAVVGYEPDLRTLTGLEFVEQNETPGLGARITEDWFREQFRGKRGPFTLVPEGTEDEGPSEFDAITGATNTSESVRDILNTSVGRASDVVAEGS